jgi:hypothetical protein
VGHFLFWLPRAGLFAAAWTAAWGFAASRNGPSDVGSRFYLPAALAVIGIGMLIALPLTSLWARRYSYWITSSRVIVFNSLTRRSVSVDLKSIDRMQVVGFWRRSSSDLIIEAGTVGGPEGEVVNKIELVGLSDAQGVYELLIEAGAARAGRGSEAVRLSG